MYRWGLPATAGIRKVKPGIGWPTTVEGRPVGRFEAWHRPRKSTRPLLRKSLIETFLIIHLHYDLGFFTMGPMTELTPAFSPSLR
jgi:hypothetical protein